MTLLNYSVTLIAGANENINDVQTMFNEVRTILNGSIDSQNIAANAVGSAELQDGAVTSAKLGTDSVTAAKIATDAVGADEIASGAVGTGEIANLAVTEGKLANDAVTAAKIAVDAVGASEIAAGAVGTGELAGSIPLTKLASGAAAQLIVGNASGVPTYRTLSGDATIDANGVIAVNSVTGGSLGDNSITQAHLQDSVVGTAELQDNAVTTAKIAAGAVGTTDIADDAVTAAKIVAGAVGASEIGTNAVGADEIAAGAVGTSELATNAATSDKVSLSSHTDTQSAGISAPGVLTGISITPGAGTYLAMASARLVASSGATQALLQLHLRVNGVNVETGPMTQVEGPAGMIYTSAVVMGIITPAAGQAVEVYATLTLLADAAQVDSGDLVLVRIA